MGRNRFAGRYSVSTRDDDDDDDKYAMLCCAVACSTHASYPPGVLAIRINRVSLIITLVRITFVRSPLLLLIHQNTEPDQELRQGTQQGGGRYRLRFPQSYCSRNDGRSYPITINVNITITTTHSVLSYIDPTTIAGHYQSVLAYANNDWNYDESDGHDDNGCPPFCPYRPTLW